MARSLVGLELPDGSIFSRLELPDDSIFSRAGAT